MKKYFYNYQTITRFDIPVIKHFFLLRCMPCVNACQQGSHKELFLHPSDSVIYGADSWGNPIQYGHKLDSHDSFTFVSSGEARILPYCIPNEKNTDMFKVASPLTEPSEAIKEFARIHKKGKNDVDTALNYANELYSYLCYMPGSTHTRTTAKEAFDLKQGVCQDYAHILLALCREAGLTARYANGFLVGIGMTHAWIEVLDDGKWYGIDPTNNKFIEYGYIKIAHGRDADDCPVNRGIFTGAATQQTEIRVIVEEI